MSQSFRKHALLPVFGAVLAMGLIAAQSASANIVRPAGATPVQTSMVIAYNPCAAASPAGQVHNQNNLPGFSCTPPSQMTPRLTAGDPVVNGSAANFRGQVKLVVATGNVLFPSPAPAGSNTNNFHSDVRCTGGYAGSAPAGICDAVGSGNVLLLGGASPNPDYTGDLNVVSAIRITDQANNGNSGAGFCDGTPTQTCPDDGTVQVLNFAVAADCSTTASTAIGGFCTPRFASANALCGCVATGKRSNIEVGVGSAPGGVLSGIFSTDGGTDGVTPNGVPDTDSPAPFSRQGVFIP
jgi:hypothetical protein